MQTKQQLVLFGMVFIALTGLFAGFRLLMLADGERSCIIPAGGGVCSFEYVLPEGKAVSMYNMDLSFEGIPSGEYIDEQVLEHIDYRLTKETGSDKVERYYNYLYKLPDSYNDVYDVRVEAVAEGSCSAGEGDQGKVYVSMYGIDIPYYQDFFEYCNEYYSRDCANYDTLILNSGWHSGDNFMRFKHSHHLSDTELWLVPLAKCNNAKPRHDSGIGTITGTIDNEYINPILAETKFYAVVKTYERGSGSAEAVLPPVVRASYRKTEHPKHLNYWVNDQKIDRFGGVQKAPVSTLDFAETINNACNRDTTIAECSVNIRFSTANKGGKIIIDNENEVLRAAVLPECQGNQTMIDHCADGNEVITHVCHEGHYTETGNMCVIVPPPPPPEPFKYKILLYLLGSAVAVISGVMIYRRYKR